eukprot:g16038.t1
MLGMEAAGRCVWQGQSTLQTEEQKNEVVEATVPLLSNLSLVFLKRNDAHNCVRAANLGLTLADRLKEKPASLQAKLLYRRGLGRSQAKDFSDALKDFVESARLLPEDREIRRTLDECKARAKEQNDRSDDTWRGAMSDSPKVKVPLTDRFLITLRRWLRATKRRARQVTSLTAVRCCSSHLQVAGGCQECRDFLNHRHHLARTIVCLCLWIITEAFAAPVSLGAEMTITYELYLLQQLIDLAEAPTVPSWTWGGGSIRSRRTASKCLCLCERLADSDIEEADIEALARSKLNSGEYILGEEPKLDQDKDYEVQDRICIAPLLLQRQSELEYKVPEGAKRVPWVDTMAIDGQTELPKGVTAKDGVKLESIFLGCPEPTQLAVKFLADCRHGFRRRSGSLQKATGDAHPLHKAK